MTQIIKLNCNLIDATDSTALIRVTFHFQTFSENKNSHHKIIFES